MITMPALDDFLDRAGVPVDSTTLLAALAQVGTQQLVRGPTRSTPLDADEASVLAEHAGVTPESDAAAHMRAQTAAKSGLLYADTLTTAQVGERTGKSPSRVRHLAQEGGLYALPVDRRSGLRFPAWQFTETGQPLPGLAPVLQSLPAGLHPLQVTGFFTTPTIELSPDGNHALSPLQWLRDGGDPKPVAELAAAVGEVP
jgi:hypothetical protein